MGEPSGRELFAKLYQGSRQARWAIASQTMVSGANFATTVIIVRTLGFEEFGRFSVCFLLMMIVRSFLTDAILTPMSTIGPKLGGSSLRGYRGFLALNAFVFAAGSSVVLAAGVYVSGVLTGAEWLTAMAFPLATANGLTVLSDYLRRYHFVWDAPAIAFFVDLSRYAVQLLALFLIAWGFDTLLTPYVAVWILALGGLTGMLFGLCFYGASRLSRRYSRSVWPRHWNFIKWMTPGTVLETVQANAPFLIGAWLLGEQALGLVRAVQQLANVLNLPVNALLQVAPAIAARKYVTEGFSSYARFLNRITIGSALFVVMTYLLILPLLDVAFDILFKIDVSGGVLFTLYSGLNLMLALRLAPQIFFQVEERPDVTYRVNLLGALIALAAPFSALVLGVSGIAAASLAATGIPVAIYYSYRQRLIEARALPL